MSSQKYQQASEHFLARARQDRAAQQQLGFLPGWTGEQRSEGNENGYNGIGQGEHGWAFSDIGVRPAYSVFILFLHFA